MQNKTPLSTLITLSMAVFTLGYGNSISRVAAQSTIPTLEECKEEHGGKLTICHATSSETNPYSIITISCNALYGAQGNAGHFDENGTPLAGHEDDILAVDGVCPDAATPTPTATTPDPTATPTGTPENSPTPNTTAVPTATPVASISPSPIASPEPSSITTTSGQRSSLGYNISCDHTDVEVTMDLSNDTTPAEGKLVTFEYHQGQQQHNTNQNGRARAFFDRGSGGQLKAWSSDYPSQQIDVVVPSDCPSDSPAGTGNGNDTGDGIGSGTLTLNTSDSPATTDTNSGKILGTSTDSELGTNKLADTSSGIFGQLIAIFQLSVTPLIASFTHYVSKK